MRNSWVKKIPENPENTEVPEGIENLFPKELFEARFYDETVTKKGDGGQKINRDLNKTRFCNWVCGQQNADHFAKFDSVVEILRQFSEAHQSHSIEQLTTE